MSNIEGNNESVNILGDWVTWIGIGGAVAAGIVSAPATAMIFLGVGLMGVGINIAGTTSCDDCIPNEFPHVE